MKFVAFERNLQGTGASRRLRNAGKVPGIVYGAGEPKMIELDHNALFFALKKEAFHSSILEMELSGAVQKVLLRDFQMHPWKTQVLHIDFQRVDATHAIHQKVPLHFVNAEIAPGVKLGGGMVSHVMNDVDVKCLPGDLPAFIEVDLKDLESGQSIHVSQLALPKGVEIVHHGEGDPVVATIMHKGGGAAVEEEAAPAAVVAPAPAKPEKKAERVDKR